MFAYFEKGETQTMTKDFLEDISFFNDSLEEKKKLDPAGKADADIDNDDVDDSDEYLHKRRKAIGKQ